MDSRVISAAGAFLDGIGTGVNSLGYAKAVKVLCDKLGIPCVIIEGEAKEGENWSSCVWNGIQTDGKWYLLDLLLDDSDSGWGYNYFLTSMPADRRNTNIFYDGTESAYPELSATPRVGIDGEHIYCVETLETINATCTTDGKTTYHCVRCGEEIEKIIKAPGIEHKYENGFCVNCGVADTLEHASVAGIVDTAYTGTEVTQKVTVSFGTNVLQSGTDYQVTYSNNKNVGTATVTISGIGRYKDFGTVTKTFKITRKPMKDLKYSAVKKQTYTGGAISPSVTVKNGSVKLKKNTDYTISYSSNKDIGTAAITIKGKGNYTGSKKIRFQILPKKAELKSLKSNGAKAMTASWSRMSGVSGYQMEYGKNRNFKGSKKITADGNATSRTVSGLTGGSTYYVRIRAYKKVGSKTYYGAWSGAAKVKIRK